MQATIHKFQFQITDRFEFRAHHVLRWLSAGVQRGQPAIWAVVDTDSDFEQKAVLVRGTGHPMTGEEGQHVGTIQLDGGSLIFHVFLPIDERADQIGVGS